MDYPPTGLAYAINPAVYEKGVEIASDVPASTGGPIATYLITPSLSAGLAIDPVSGVIGGTPTILAPLTTYTITATNTGGSTTAFLEITVNDVPPLLVGYELTPAIYQVGKAIQSNSPINTGGAALGYSIDPALPMGVEMDSRTGAITGLPAAQSNAASYQVTATNSGGSSIVQLTITVIPAGPSISEQPQDQIVTAGAAAQFSVSASGTGVLQYQWSKDGIPIAGATNTTYATSPTSCSIAGEHFSVAIVDSYGSTVTSALAGLFVHGCFFPIGAMTAPRGYFLSALLPGGNLLFAGGQSTDNSALASAEQYSPNGNSFTAGDSMSVSRVWGTATLLANGLVLIAGGNATNAAELFDPTTGSFSGTGSMTSARVWHTATLLSNNKVLIAGGDCASGPTCEGDVGSSAELYDPVAGTFAATGSMTTSRLQQTATLLQDGRVLIAGGQGLQPNGSGGALASAEIYDPTTGVFTSTYTMTQARAGHTATLLLNGDVLIAGAGSVGGDAYSNSAETFDITTGFNATGSMGTGRWEHRATLLPNGEVLITGGSLTGDPTATAEMYNPDAGEFTQTGSMSMGRLGHCALLLQNGTVLVAGGLDSLTGALSSVEGYTP